MLSSATNQTWFSVSLFVLRVIVGLQILLFGIARLSDWSVVSELGVDACFKSWFADVFAGCFLESILPWLFVVFGALIILGAFIRPVSLVMIVLLVFVYAWSYQPGELISMQLIQIVIFGFFLSGGIGHVIGLDHVLFHYAREKTLITQLLLG